MEIDLPQLLGVGGTTGLIAFLAGLLVKTFFEAKKDKRLQQEADNQETVGVISNTKTVLGIVEEQTERMAIRIKALEESEASWIAKARALEGELAVITRTAAFLQQDLDRLRSSGTGAT